MKPLIALLIIAASAAAWARRIVIPSPDNILLTAVVDNSPDEDGKKIKRSFRHRFLRGE